MASVGRSRAFGSDPPTGSGRARGSLYMVLLRLGVDQDVVNEDHNELI